jgi:hypothetical protein
MLARLCEIKEVGCLPKEKMTDGNKKKDFRAATEAKKVPKAALMASAE